MTIREINETIEEGESLKDIAISYGEIASFRIKQIRAAVEKSRLFLDEITQIYRIVKQQAVLKKVAIKKNKRVVSILLTSNFGFYGNIDTEVIHQFLVTTPKFPTDRIVIGKTGQEYLKAMRYFNRYESVTLKNDLPAGEELKMLDSLIRDYNQVLVFYPKLQTLLVQKAILADITQSFLETLKERVPQNISYVIFEPELEKILRFFDSQIITLLLEQTFFEAELARTGSRILSMDQAQVEANKFIEKQKQLKTRTKRAVEDAHLLDNLASLQAIKKLQT